MKNILRKIKPAVNPIYHYCQAGNDWEGCKFPGGMECPGIFIVAEPRDG